MGIAGRCHGNRGVGLTCHSATKPDSWRQNIIFIANWMIRALVKVVLI